MTRTRPLILGAVVACVSLMLSVKGAEAQTDGPLQVQQDPQEHHHASEPSSDAKVQSLEPSKQAVARQGMMADMHAGNAKLDALVTKMNASTGEARVDAIVELLTAMVQQHKSMCEQMMGSSGMMQMHGEMMRKDDAK